MQYYYSIETSPLICYSYGWCTVIITKRRLAPRNGLLSTGEVLRPGQNGAAGLPQLKVAAADGEPQPAKIQCAFATQPNSQQTGANRGWGCCPSGADLITTKSCGGIRII